MKETEMQKGLAPYETGIHSQPYARRNPAADHP